MSLLNPDLFFGILEYSNLIDCVHLAQTCKQHMNCINVSWKEMWEKSIMEYPELDNRIPNISEDQKVNYANKFKIIHRLDIFKKYTSSSIEPGLTNSSVIDLFKKKVMYVGYQASILEEIRYLTNLVNLELTGQKMIPEIYELPSLWSLSLSKCNIQGSEMNKLTRLCNLILRECVIDDNFGLQIASLKLLTISKCNLTKIPDFVFSLTELLVLNISGNSISDIPERILTLKNLEKLNIKSNKMLYLDAYFDTQIRILKDRGVRIKVDLKSPENKVISKELTPDEKFHRGVRYTLALELCLVTLWYFFEYK
jgi:Leucine-rich repeat (LRR) protein